MIDTFNFPMFELALQEELKQVASLRSFKDGESIITAGQAVRFIPILLKGSIKVSRVNESGDELFLYYLETGDTCSITFTCCMQRKQSQVNAVCEGDVELLIIPLKHMDEWMSKYPTWKSFVMNTIQEKMDELLLTIDHIAFNNLDERLLTYLKGKVDRSKSNIIDATHNEIAKDLGTSRVVISRLLKKLEKNENVVLGRNSIEFKGM